MRRKIDAFETSQGRLLPAVLPRWLLPAFFAIASSAVHAAPAGGEISAGSGSISHAGSTVTIDQSSSRLAINWQTFSIGSGESVVFQQPSAQSIALNRILGQDPSVILGNLSANGQVFLLNPNGVLFGAGSQVDVGGILASTMSLSDGDFLAGRLTLSGAPGSDTGVLNRGTIRASDGGYVAFAATNVANEGVISARLGTVALGAGEQVTLNIDGDQLVGFSVDKAAVAALAANRQLIQADGGTVILSALAKDALLARVVNNDGIIEARSVSSENGVIRLEGGNDGVVAVSGLLDASGRDADESGGQVLVTGANVALLDGAVVDASGRAGGGVVRIGGDFQGKNADVQNAQRTFVASSAEIRADAQDAGDGGRVIVWADGDTRFHGTVSARGGSTGDGGFVEISGKQQLGFDGSVDTSAANGKVGSLLLDPDDLYIAAAPVGGAVADASNPFQAIDGVNDYYVLGATLNGLAANTAVSLQANRNIIFQTNLAMLTASPAGSVTMTAANGIQMGGFDLSTVNGNVSMTAGAGGISNLGTIALGTGVLTLNSSGAITQNAGDVIQSAGSLVKLGSGTLTLSGANTYIGATTISAGTVVASNAAALGTTAAGTTVASGATLNLNNVAIADALTINGAGVGGNGALTGSGTASSSAAVAMGSASSIGTATAGDTLTLTGPVSGAFALTKLGAGTLVLGGANTYTGVTAINGGTLAVTANNALGTTAGGTTIASGSTLDLRNVAYSTAEGLINNGGTLLASTGTSSFAGAMALGANSTVNVTGAQLTLSGVTSGAAFGIDKQGAGTLVLSGANTYTGTTAVNGGTLRLGAAARIADTSAVTVANGATFDLNNFAETVGSIAGAGAVTLGTATLTAGGDGTSTTFAGPLSGTGGLTKAGAGVLTLSGTNTYTGATTINGGTLRVTGSNAIADASQVTLANTAGVSLDVQNDEVIGNLGGGGAAGGNVTLNGNTLTVSEAGSTTFAGIASGTGGLTKLGAGTLTMSGANTYTGTTAVNAGTLASGANNVFADGTSIVVNGGTLAMGTRTDTVAGVALIGGSITGTTGVLTSSSNYDVQAGTISAILAGAVALNKSTGGTVILSGANTYTGATAINAGTLRLGAANRIADTSAVTIAGGATFDLNNFAETVGSVAGAGSIALGSATLTAGGDGTSTALAGAVTGTGGLTKVGAGALTLAGANTYTGATTVNGGTLRAAGGNAIADASQVTLANTAGVAFDLQNNETIGNLGGGGAAGGNVTLNGNTLTVNEAGATTYTGVVSGTGGLAKQGAGTLTLAGANTYSGATAINAGSLALGANNVLANTTQVIVNGGTLAMTTRGDTVAGVQLLSGSITGTTGVLTSASAYDLQSGTVSAILAGAVPLNKSTGGTVVLSGANTYTGATAISGGILQLGAANRIADTSAVTIANGATFDLNNFAETVGSIAGAGNVTLGTATLTSGGDGTSTTLAGSVTGTGGLTKLGAGTLTLSGANTYSGVTTVSGGTLRAVGGSAIGDASQVTLANTAGVLLDVQNDEAVGNLGGGGATGGNVALNGNTLTVNEAGATTFAGVASGAGGLIKQGAGALTLTGVNTYTGPTTINGGTLALTGGTTLVDTGVVNLNGGALVVNTNETIGRLAGANGTALTLNATLTFGDGVDTSIASTIGGAGGLTKRGAGAVTLSGANAYSGATAVNAGTLIAASASALGATASGTTVGSGATLQIANAAIGAEAVTLNGAGAGGAGALVGTGNASLAGAVTLATDSTVGAPGAGDLLALNGAVNGARVLTQTGQGTVAFNNTVGTTTALTSFASVAAATTQINGGSLRTSGTQLYNGALVVGAPASLQTTNSSVIANGAVNAAAGALTFATGTGAVTMTNPANDFGTLAFTNAGTVNLIDANALAFGVSNVATMRAQTLAGDITINGTMTATGSGDSIVLAAGGNFSNNAGSTALNAGAGRRLVWSTDPAFDSRGGLTFAFKQYDADYGVTAVAGAGNGFLYSVAPTITPSLTGTVSKVYDGTTTAVLTGSNYFATGAIDGDTIVFNNPAAGAYDTRNVATGKNVSAAGVSIVSATNGAATVYGYQLASTTANGAVGSVTPAALTIAATTNIKTYDGTVIAVAAPAVTGLVGGDTVANLSEAYTNRNAGAGKTLSVATYLINDGNGGNNYVVSTIDNNTGVINAASLIGSIASGDRTYDGTTNASITARTLSGVIAGDNVSYVGGVAAFADRNAGVGKTVTATGLSLTGADAGNYTVNGTATTTADITPLAVVGSVTAANKVYDATTAATITGRTLTGAITGDAVSYVGGTATFADKNAASGKTVTATGLGLAGADAGNYTVNGTATTTADITPLAVVGSVTAANKVYDATTAATITGRTLTGAIAGDTVSYVGGAAAFADKNAAVGKTVAATGLGLTGADAGNYTVNGTATTAADITPLAVAGTVTAGNKVYDATTAATITGRALTGAIAGDAVSYVGGTATFADKNAASGKTVTATGLSLAGADAGNYTVNGAATTTADITPLAVVGSVTAANKVYDATTAATITGRTLTGAIAGDAVSYVGGAAAFADKNAGAGKTVTATGLGLAGADAGNYTVNDTATTTADITPLTIVGSVTAANKVYDATTGATITGRALTGAFAGDAVSYVGGVATFADKNAAAGKAVTATGLGLAGADAANYTVNTTATTTADITPLTIVGSVTAANRVYDGTVAATIATRTVAGVLGGDTVSYVGGTATFADQNAGVGKTVTANGLSLAGTDAGNYTVNATATTLADITPRLLTVAADAGQAKVYGDADPLPFTYAITSGDLVAGDSLSGALSRISGENVGSYAITQNTLTAGTNYALTFDSNPFAITPATLTYRATRVQIEQGSAFPPFTGTVEGFKRGDTLASATTGTPAFATDAADSSHLGIFAIDGEGLTANFGNYTFVQAATNATALVITPPGEPSGPDGSIGTIIGAVASALQTEGVCSQFPVDEAAWSCRTMDEKPPEPGALHSTPVAGTAFAREGAGIRLPAGTAVE